MDKIKRIKELVTILNEARDEYYNKSNNHLSDKEYDDLFDELQSLENETGTILNNSPTQTVGYEVKSKLEKVVHNHPMLSLDKTKSVTDIVGFLDGRDGIAMLKMDGLTCSTKHNGMLLSAETRGNGEIGEDILSNAKTITNIPLRVSITDELIVDGEVIIDYDTFNKINEKLSDDEKYKNPRNLASGSIRQLDSSIAAQRNMKFVAWKVIKGIDSNSHCTRLNELEKLGFTVVPFISIYNIKNKKLMEEKIEEVINQLKKMAKELNYPIDGIVFGYNDIAYGESLGMTGHHIRSQIAYKFYDEEVETTLLDVEWSPSRTGLLNPVAIFEPVEIDGTTVGRASLHNLSIIEDLKIGIGDTITVYKANQIIPQVKENLTKSDNLSIPSKCPICGEMTRIKQDNDSKVLYCTNPNCKSKLLGRLTHFVSKHAMNVDGMSEATIEKFVELGWLNDLIDIYNLKQYRNKMIILDGFGVKSADKLLDAIEESKNVKLENFIYSLGIPLIGRTASKTISKYCKGDIDKFEIMVDNNLDFTKLDDFGTSMNESIHKWFKNNNNASTYGELAELLSFIQEQSTNNATDVKSLEGLTFVITGSVNHYKNRDELKADIEARQGKVAGSVSKSTSYLINNDNTSTSGKNKKAQELGIKIITEDEFLEMIK